MKKVFVVVFLLVLLMSCDENYDGIDERGEYVNMDNEIISGTWAVALAVDSVVWVFENDVWKEYVFQKGTNIILDRVEHGEYSLRRSYYDEDDTYIVTNLNRNNRNQTYTPFVLNENRLFSRIEGSFSRLSD
ncbi:hypothetical protein [Dysgonomonas sp. 520]|uniref:hypothetical protein n=1 Tax=Dysgonomonas sp. 520 TaxID=2302931 RepID=UPI0013D6A20F|nr:hypothetical protein [Dysgonomonas sp. 520]NDW10081.1 hypothetical protein [Dysgonomonas sp. 520]